MRWVYKLFKCACGNTFEYGVAEEELSTMLTRPCSCGELAVRSDRDLRSSKQVMDAVHAEGGVRIFENGKRKTLGTKRAVKEYADKNQCTFGSDDLEQEATHNKDRADKEYTERIAEKVMEDFQRRRK